MIGHDGIDAIPTSLVDAAVATWKVTWNDTLVGMVLACFPVKNFLAVNPYGLYDEVLVEE